MWRRWIVLIGFLIGTTRGVSAEEQRGHWLLVTAPAFRAELEPLIAQRRADGFDLSIAETTNVLSREQIEQGNGAPLRDYIQQWSDTNPGPKCVLLAGAFFASNPTNVEPFVVPPLTGTIERMKGQPSDHGYSLPANDGSPSIAVGRFPARTTREMRSMVEKTLKFENDREPAAWQNRLLLLAGNPGGGMLAEMVVEPSLTPRLQRLHPSWNAQVVSGISASRYYLPGRNAPETFLRSLAEGELFTIFAGHSTAPAMWVAGEDFVTRDDLAKVKIARGAGIFVTCGCFSCALRGRTGEGYGLTAMRNPGGPSAVIGAIGESFAAPGTLALDGLLSRMSIAPFPSRLADYWLAVQAGLARGEIDNMTFNLYDQFDGSKGKVPLAVQRLEHLEMWLLLGDPAMRLPLTPVDVVLNVSGEVKAGKSIAVKGSVPDRLSGAVVRVSLERPLASMPSDLEKSPESSPGNQERDPAHIQMAKHARANQFALSETTVVCDGKNFGCAVQIPLNLPWTNLVVRAYASSSNNAALGTMVLSVAK